MRWPARLRLEPDRLLLDPPVTAPGPYAAAPYLAGEHPNRATSLEDEAGQLFDPTGVVPGLTGIPAEDDRLRPLYARVLGLGHVDPGGILCFVFFEGAVILGFLLALAELISWWGVLILPATVAVMVKVNDLVAAAVARSAARVPELEQERFRREIQPVVGRAKVPGSPTPRLAGQGFAGQRFAGQGFPVPGLADQNRAPADLNRADGRPRAGEQAGVGEQARAAAAAALNRAAEPDGRGAGQPGRTMAEAGRGRGVAAVVRGRNVHPLERMDQQLPRSSARGEDRSHHRADPGEQRYRQSAQWRYE